MFILLNKMKKNVRNSRTNQSEVTDCYEACYYFELLRPVEVIDAFSDVEVVRFDFQMLLRDTISNG
ncbi:hypothetical protein T4D_2746 [Trichinella pseudospiralis]|uniref:Uncharacterized protein n=1 Tax=Trichinella pseudospiralis TaxID=6337 RepID=A0A0V1FXH1_TRIPS|nr:hypothetical protein T4D_2746 [Trichinella pseudospiralis]